MVLRWLRWSVMLLCSGNLAKWLSLILSQVWALRSAACPYSCSEVIYGRLIQYSFSASRSRCFTILRFICHVIGLLRRYFPIHCLPGMPFLSSARVRNIFSNQFQICIFSGTGWYREKWLWLKQNYKLSWTYETTRRQRGSGRTSVFWMANKRVQNRFSESLFYGFDYIFIDNIIKVTIIITTNRGTAVL